MLRPPPLSTLFPYTTLFRSFPVFHGRLNHFFRSRVEPVSGPPRQIAPDFGNGFPAAPVDIGKPERDRKSTRLNSSHRTISYAVFCLKKKNSLHDLSDKLRND